MAVSATSPIEELRRKRNSHRFAFVLLSQFALIAAYPLAGEVEGPRPGVFGIIAMAVFLAGLYQVAEERRIRAFALILCTLAAIGNVLLIFGHNGLIIPTGVCAISYMVFVTSVILWKVLSSAKVTVETLYGAVCAYLFIGIVWGMAYSLIGQIWPGSFRYTYDVSKHMAWPDYSFFSIVTLTTIGYGDVVPVGRVKALVMMEGIIGAMYPPILIGRLLTLHGRSDTL